MYAYIVMTCSVVSASSSLTCLLDICFAMFQFFTKSESVNDNCYVHVVAIVFSDPFWLMVSKRLLLYALSRFMPCLALP